MTQRSTHSHSESQGILSGIWSELLRIKDPRPEDSFFDLGGDSLAAIQLISRIRKQLGISLTWGQLCAHPSLAKLSAVIDASSPVLSNEGFDDLTPADRTQPIPLSFPQKSVWFVQQLDPGSTAYNARAILTLKGDLNAQAIKRSLQTIIERHEIFRTAFIEEDGIPVQQVLQSVSIELPVIDLSDLPSDEKNSRFSDILEKMLGTIFRLDAPPLAKWALIRLSDQHHTLVHVEHHLIHDGWSSNRFFHELTQIYDGIVRSQDIHLDPLPIQFADFAAWQNRWIETKEAAEKESFWLKQLTPIPSVLTLPSDRVRPAVQSYEGEAPRYEVPSDVADRLRSLCAQEGVTLFMAMFAAFMVLLRRYSGQGDISVGSGIANRQFQEAEPLIGMIVNTIVLRMEILPDDSFLTVLRKTANTCLDAYSNQDYPFERLVEKLHPSRSLSFNPLFQIAFSFHDAPFENLNCKNLEVELEEALSNGSSKFDLNIVAIPHLERRRHQDHKDVDHSIALVWEYSSDLFDRKTIDRMVEHYICLLDSAVSRPEQPIQTLNMLSPQELELLNTWNATQAPYPNKCIHNVFEERVRQSPDAIALATADVQMSYGELNRLANRLAHYLKGLKLERGAGVGILMQRSVEMVIAVLATLKAGGAYVPFDPAYPKERLAFMLSDTSVQIVLTEFDLRDRLPAFAGTVLCLDKDTAKYQREPDTNPELDGSPEDLAYIIYTSGSTGTPKGVRVPHRGVVRLVFGQDFVHLDAQQRLLLLAPISFDASTFEIWGALLHGARCAIFQDSVPTIESLSSALSQFEISVLWLTSGFFNAIIDESPDILGSVTQLLTGGEALSVAHICRALAALPQTQLINGYGPTENTTFTCCYRIPGELSRYASSVPIGKPIANTQVYIVDEALKQVPIGLAGELYIGGDGLAQGYHERADLSAAAFVRNPFSNDPQSRLYRTGDMARWREDGLIEFVGRIDYQVKIRGFRIELGEIETVLGRHSEIKKNVVLVLGDRADDKQLIAYIERAGNSTVDAKGIQDYLRSHLPSYMIPSRIVFLNRLPVTSNGKVDRQALATTQTSISEESGEGGTTPVEEKLLSIWEDLLDRSPISIEQNFFDIGGHSLLAMRLFARIEKEFGRQLPLATLFKHSTVAQLALLIDEAEQILPWSPVVEIKKGTLSQPLFLVHALDGEVLCYADLADHLTSDSAVYGLQARGLQGDTEPCSEIPEMARVYIEAIRSIQPHGPYIIAGYSLGGTIAYEMALQLEQAGEVIDLLGILDTSGKRHYGEPRIEWKLAGLIPVVVNFFYWLSSFIKKQPVQQIRSLRRHLGTLMVKLGSWFIDDDDLTRNYDARLNEIHKRLRLAPLPPQRKKVREVHHRALMDYVRTGYRGDITLFKAARTKNFTQAADPELGWSSLTHGKVHVRTIKGEHRGFLDMPQVTELARVMSKEIEDACQHDASTDKPSP